MATDAQSESGHDAGTRGGTCRSFCPVAMALPRLLIVAIVMVGLWNIRTAAAQTTWYVCSGITGADAGGITGPDVAITIAASDSNAGTDPAFPLLTLGVGGLQSRMSDGDTACLSGRFSIPDSTPIGFSSPLACNRRTFAQWPGMAPAVIRGSNKVSASGWVPTGTAAFTKNIGAGLGATLATVVFDYDSAGNLSPLGDGSPDPTLGRRTSHLTPATESAVLAAGPNRPSGIYYYNNATGFLTVCLPGGASPASAVANGIEYSVRGRNAFYLTSTSNNDRVNAGNVFQGLRFVLWADAGTGSPRGTPIVIGNGDGTLITGCVFEDSGIHSYSFGSRCTNNSCINNVHIGMAPGGIASVFNASGSTAGAPNAAWGCRIVGDVVYANSFLAHDGTLANRGSAVGAFICHGPITDISLENFQVKEYTPPGGAAPDACTQFSVADAPPPADRFDPATYAVRIRQTDPALATVSNGTAWPNQSVVSNAAYMNCVLRFPQLAASGTGSMIDLRGCVGTTGFFGCEFTADLGNPAVPVAMFTIGAKSSIVNVNCSGYDTASTHGPQKYSVYRYAAAGGTIFDFQSAWGFRSTIGGSRYVCTGDAAIGSAYHWFQDTAFWNVGATTYSENGAFNTSAEWSTVIDAVLGGVTLHLAENPFIDTTGASGLAPTPAFASLKKLIDVHAEDGVNGHSYDGSYGAYQFGGALCPADFNADGFVSGEDFDAFVLEFFWGNAAADIDGDGFVTGMDFDTFMDSFVAGC